MKARRTIAVAALSVLGTSAAAQMPEARAVEYGIEQRVRNEQWDNITDFDSAATDTRNQIRWRTRAWVKIPMTSSVDAAIGMNQETNQIIEPRRVWRADEAVFETAYVELKNLFGKPLHLRVGRQNLMFGEGFLLIEGNAWDGSRTVYFNALDLSYIHGRSRWDLLAISNPRSDRYLPRIHDRQRTLTEWDEQAIGVYHATQISKKATVEAYYFAKRESHDPRAESNYQFQPDRTVHTAGARGVRSLGHGATMNVELAQQWGLDKRGVAASGSGGYAYVKKSLGTSKRAYATAGYWSFSGDDPSTGGTNEGWDPLFSRFPKWSELYIYTQLKERGVAYWTNLYAWQGEVGYSPRKPIKTRFTIYRMNSYQPYRPDCAPFGTGTYRGFNWQTRADITANRHWSGHVVYERFHPGDFYVGRSPGHFLRFEILFQWRDKVVL